MSVTNRWLAGLLALLVVLAVLGAALVRRTHQDRLDARVAQERYGAVLAAANAEATAFVNLRYDRAEQTVGAVAAGATGSFRAHYASASGRVVRVLQRHRSSMVGHVVWSGVVQVDPTNATVIVATAGTVANDRTGGRPVERSYRLRLSLVAEDGRWLTSNVQFVGGTS
ncbi:nuclear transport factor 2 family protein [Nocardioides cynanchi]|uniref:nuclear transport factor 2 family protein n=1 Tax=Nocardioides cynanchi TaxID=2558918 RepID=UPI001247CA3F|nr:nuclear transport factor 2 family protein [Nocardioides cynanchi]